MIDAAAFGHPVRSLRDIPFQPMAPHCWGPPMPELMAKMAAHMERTAPARADLRSWRY